MPIVLNNMSCLMTNIITDYQYSALLDELKLKYSGYFDNENNSLCVMTASNDIPIVIFDSTRGSVPYGYNSASEATNRIANGTVAFNDFPEPSLGAYMIAVKNTLTILGLEGFDQGLTFGSWVTTEPRKSLLWVENPNYPYAKTYADFWPSVLYTIRYAKLTDATNTVYGYLYWVERNKRTAEMNRDGSEQYNASRWSQFPGGGNGGGGG